MQHVLIVDDSKAIHAYLQSLLEESGPRLSHAYSGEEALSLYPSLGAIDLLLIDGEMPGISGPETARALRGLAYKGPILMITTRNQAADIQHALDQGVDDYMMKPFTRDILMAKIDALKGVV